jgi:hypothetical protein
MESPRQRFLKQPEDELKRVATVLRSDTIWVCCDTALLEYVWNQTPTNDPMTSAANQHRLEGARAFANLLMTLADPTKKVEPPKPVGVLEEVKRP